MTNDPIISDIRKFYYEKYNGKDYLIKIGCIAKDKNGELKVYIQFGETFRRNKLEIDNKSEFENSKGFQITVDENDYKIGENVFELIIPDKQDECDF